jgi:hypothetical protein
MVLLGGRGVTYIKKMRSTEEKINEKGDRRWRALTQRKEGTDAGREINK